MAGRILNTEEYFRHLQKHFHVPKKFSASLYDDLNYWDKLAVWWVHSKCSPSSYFWFLINNPPYSFKLTKPKLPFADDTSHLLFGFTSTGYSLY